MKEQEIKNTELFIVELTKMQQAIYLACDVSVAEDVSSKTLKAIKLIRELVIKNESINDQLKMAYCGLIGSDSTIGLDSCDDYKEWLQTLTK